MGKNQVSQEHYIPAVNGDHPSEVTMAYCGNHQHGIKVLGPLTTGTLTISAKSPGGSGFELVPDGAIDLTAITSLLFTFVAAEYNFNLTNVTGSTTGTQIVITDIPMEL
tara:strand:+ start:5953 stop:6279 length:327 start_codon:yes stop_codon:yes gene_type:complete